MPQPKAGWGKGVYFRLHIPEGIQFFMVGKSHFIHTQQTAQEAESGYKGLKSAHVSDTFLPARLQILKAP